MEQVKVHAINKREKNECTSIVHPGFSVRIGHLHHLHLHLSLGTSHINTIGSGISTTSSGCGSGSGSGSTGGDIQRQGAPVLRSQPAHLFPIRLHTHLLGKLIVLH